MYNLISKKTIYGLYLILFSISSAWADSRCKEESILLPPSNRIICSYQSVNYPVDESKRLTRSVLYELPIGKAPKGGWPVVLLYQGSLFGQPLTNFHYNSLMPFGGFYEGKLIQKLLDNGYAVIYPSAINVIPSTNSPLTLFWATNVPPFSLSDTAYKASSDFYYITSILDGIKKGSFGPLNPDKKYATGISSGGYNTSRMAISYPGEFKALAIQSGSYATCSGPLCLVPSSLPKNHPPTYLLNGLIDPIVPQFTSHLYYDRLLEQGIPTERYIEPTGTHEWFKSSPERILKWFNKYN